MAELDREVAREIGGKVFRHRLEFYGTCSECLEVQAAAREA